MGKTFTLSAHRKGAGFEVRVTLYNRQIGRACITSSGSGRYCLAAIDVKAKYQRRGLARQMLQQIKEELIARNATSLSSSNEGSGTVQLLHQTFGDRAQHFCGQTPIELARAIQIMDVEFHYTRSLVCLAGTFNPGPTSILVHERTT